MQRKESSCDKQPKVSKERLRLIFSLFTSIHRSQVQGEGRRQEATTLRFTYTGVALVVGLPFNYM